MEDGYPTELELTVIEKWNFQEQGVEKLLEFIGNMWWSGGWGFKLTGKKVLKLALHTGGWSGNESIIGALKNNFIFWSMYWVMHKRGGHYYFEIRLK